MWHAPTNVGEIPGVLNALLRVVGPDRDLGRRTGAANLWVACLGSGNGAALPAGRGPHEGDEVDCPQKFWVPRERNVHPVPGGAAGRRGAVFDVIAWVDGEEPRAGRAF